MTLRVGDNIHVGQQLVQGTHDCSWQVSLSKELHKSNTD